MKKIIFIFTILFTLTINISAQNVSWLKAYELAIRDGDYWTEWISVDVDIKIDFDDGIITIYSKELQKYYVIEQTDTPADQTGEQLGYKVINKDGIVGRFRFRKQQNGTKQIYIDFKNISWVYNIK